MKTSAMTRRRFGGQLLAAGAAGALGCGRASKPQPVALQLYTLRDLMQQDFTGVLEKVAEIGYDAVEFAGYGGLGAAEVMKRLEELGLRCAGTHEGFERLSDALDQTLEFNAAIGNRYIICPAMPGQWRGSGTDGFRAFGEQLNRIGEKVKAAGMQLCYHNHDFEFVKEGDQLLIDALFGVCDPDLVKAEVDVYWVQRGGQDPAQFIRRLGDRVALLHMKDMAGDAQKSFAPVGTGVMDMASIVAAGREIGVEWYVVEQDQTQRPPLDAVEISLKNMRALLKA